MPVCDIQPLAWPDECVRTWFYLECACFPCHPVWQVMSDAVSVWPRED